jgi:hypothetical protein
MIQKLARTMADALGNDRTTGAYMEEDADPKDFLIDGRVNLEVAARAVLIELGLIPDAGGKRSHPTDAVDRVRKYLAFRKLSADADDHLIDECHNNEGQEKWDSADLYDWDLQGLLDLAPPQNRAI